MDATDSAVMLQFKQVPWKAVSAEVYTVRFCPQAQSTSFTDVVSVLSADRVSKGSHFFELGKAAI
jgi:hypothetical protein